MQRTIQSSLLRGPQWKRERNRSLAQRWHIALVMSCAGEAAAIPDRCRALAETPIHEVTDGKKDTPHDLDACF